MSVMILQAETFQNIARTLESGGYSVNGSRNMLKSDSLRNMFYYGKEDEIPMRNLILDLCKLNEVSYNRRYKIDGIPELYKFIDFTKGAKTSPEQLLKSLRCLRYNIEENETDVIETTKTNILDTLIMEVTEIVLYRSELFNNATWG